MWYRGFPVLLAVFLFLISCIQASSDCGRLDESQLKNGKLITEPNEHSWIGLIDRNAKCLAILIDVRHALVPGNCIFADNPNVSISFGIRDSSSISAEIPQRVLVSEVQVDPESDLTLLTLKNDVVLSDSVQPICLPSVEDLKGDKSEDDLILSGYETPRDVPGSTPVEKKRIKML
ncbi:hypothetical protein KR026_003210 [Drosophila bipectinata]|nr:hypothetical protein KR026_003210 [Drosophila bipectinata]